MNPVDSQADACARFVDDSVSIARVRISRAGMILDANRHAENLIGEPLAGRSWNAMLLNFAGPTDFTAWRRESAMPARLNVRTGSGLPVTLRVTVEVDGDDYLLFGEMDSTEQTRLARDVLGLNGELNNLTRELAHRNAELAEALREKEGLLRETHHRVKNNLALITSLMRLTADQSPSPEARAALIEMQARVHSVVALNETLYKTATYTSVRLDDYLREISTYVFRAQAPTNGRVDLHLDLETLEVETGQAIPCGLIVNELVTNSLKHGFPEARAGTVRVTLSRDAREATTLRVADDGVGLPADFAARRGHSLGLQLVSDLARQLSGTFDVGPGAAFTVVF